MVAGTSVDCVRSSHASIFSRIRLRIRLCPLLSMLLRRTGSAIRLRKARFAAPRFFSTAAPIFRQTGVHTSAPLDLADLCKDAPLVVVFSEFWGFFVAFCQKSRCVKWPPYLLYSFFSLNILVTCAMLTSTGCDVIPRPNNMLLA